MEFKDIQDLLPDIDGDDPLVQEILRDEVSRLEATLHKQRRNLTEVEIESKDLESKCIPLNEVTLRLKAGANDVKGECDQIDKVFRKLVETFDNAKKKELLAGLHQLKVRFLNDLLQQYEALVNKLADCIPDTEKKIFGEAERICTVLNQEKSSVQAAFRDAVAATNAIMVKGLNVDVEMLGSSSSTAGGSQTRQGYMSK